MLKKEIALQPRSMKQSHIPDPAIVFDFGGVLLDWNPRYLYRRFFDGDPTATERFLTEIGFYAWNDQQDKGRPLDLGTAELSRQFPHYADLIKAYYDRWEESLAGPIQPTVDILYSLKQVGHCLYALSNWSAETFRRVRHKYAFLDWFEAIVLSGEVKLIKPDPQIFLVFLERIGRMAEECLLIDDSAANVAAARQLGFDTIRFESPGQLRQELCQRGLLAPDS